MHSPCTHPGSELEPLRGSSGAEVTPYRCRLCGVQLDDRIHRAWENELNLRLLSLIQH